MTEEAKKLKAEYLKNWRKNNPEKVKAYETRFWEKRAKEVNEKI